MAARKASEDSARQWYEHKSRLMEATLGKEHDKVLHAIIPFAVGGALDLYMYPNGLPGTAIATKELCELPNQGPSNDVYRSYELVMFTKHRLDPDAVSHDGSAFNAARINISAILNPIARYSTQATLKPNDTCEFPADMKRVGGKCLIFDGYACHSDELADRFGLLAVIEIFRSEMEFARKNRGATLIERLKAAGDYPYSDLNRDPVA